jgi:two-component system, NtrC family, nitrogen regulation response regulator GlnG
MKPLSILLVDDDADFRGAVARVLRKLGHVVHEADGAPRALRSLQIEPVQVVITDILMPEGDGIALINGIKAAHRDAVIVAMSGRGSLGALNVLSLATKLGAHAVLSKPFSIDELLATLEGLIPRPGGPSRG